MSQYKAVFFDLGGTLRIAEEDPDHIRKARDRMAELAGYEDPQAFIEMVEARYVPYRDWALSKNLEAGDYELWKKWLLPELDDEVLKKICHEITYQYRQYKGLRHLVDGGLEVIRTLHERGYKLGIISNLIGENEIYDWLKEDRLEGYFEAVVLSSVIHIRKPDPRMYLIACEKLGLDPSECVNVADNIKRDFTGAKEAGIGLNIMFISPDKLKTRKLTRENYPDYIVHRFTDILDLPELQ